MARLLFLAPVIAIIGVGVYFLLLKSPPPLPKLDNNAWWGPDSLKAKQDVTVKPFTVKFSDAMIADLKSRLKHQTKWTPPLEGVSAEYGFNSGWLGDWLQYWEQKYPFAAREKYLNSLPQFKTNIQGLDIHFIRVKPQATGKTVVPILLMHGWPGSVVEFYDAIPLLTADSKDRDFVLEVIAPSLPGYGFSDAAVRPGLGAAEIAVVLKNLMHRLGYKQFYVQGGDWGAVIGTHMATLFPETVLGFHTNMATSVMPCTNFLTLVGSIYPPLIVEPKLADRMYPLKDIFSFIMKETGYLHIQSTKPDTVGVALSDSPAGLLAYIVEKFATWTVRSSDGTGLTKFSRDKLLDNLMLYWSTNSITTSMRLYAETMNKRHFGLNLESIPTSVPTWVIQAKYELGYQPPLLLKSKFNNLVDVTVLDDGGHFLAFEQPKVFADDVLKAVGVFRQLKLKKTEL